MESPRVALMQPAFLPWQGYFGLVAAADVFVLLDDFQFQRHSFHQRNRIRLADGSDVHSVPVAYRCCMASRPRCTGRPRLRETDLIRADS